MEYLANDLCFHDFLLWEKHFSSAVRAELDLRRNVAGSAAACHAANNQLLEIKVSRCTL